MADIVQSWLPGGLSETAKAPIRKRGLRRLMRRHSMIAFLMCLPLIAIVVGLIIYPAFYSIYLSMLNKAQTRFIGLSNFTYLLSRDVFWMVVRQSAIFAVSAVLFKALIAPLLAGFSFGRNSKAARALHRAALEANCRAGPRFRPSPG